MSTLCRDPFDQLSIDNVEFYVKDLRANTEWLVERYGLVAKGAERASPGARSIVLRAGRVGVIVTQGLAEEHPASVYVERHGDGVGTIALRVAHADAAYDAAVGRGASAVAAPAVRDGNRTASVTAFGDVVHAFVERGSGWDDPVPTRTGLRDIDHLAVCLDAGTIEATVAFYRQILGFEVIFAEDIVVGNQAMISQVVQSRSGLVTLTLIEPDLSRDPGQIDGFLKDHDGPGVQHVAWSTENAVASVAAMRARGVEFLSAPGAYYALLADRISPSRHRINDLREHNILIDEDHDGQLFQIFTKSVHPRGTLFMEVIERVGARSFGSGNIRALYEAVELERAMELSVRCAGQEAT